MGTHAGGEKFNWVIQDQFDPEATGILAIPVQETGRHRTVEPGRHRVLDTEVRPRVASPPVKQWIRILMALAALVTVGSLIGFALNGNVDRASNSTASVYVPPSSQHSSSSAPNLLSASPVITPLAVPTSEHPPPVVTTTTPAPTQDPVEAVKPAPIFTPAPVSPFCDDKQSCQAYAKQIVPADQWSCFNTLIEKESGWRPFVWNAGGSGAYGLVQALPASKMSSEGSDWETNGATQLRWGLDYMNERYGGPCAALQFHLSHNWY